MWSALNQPDGLAVVRARIEQVPPQFNGAGENQVYAASGTLTTAAASGA